MYCGKCAAHIWSVQRCMLLTLTEVKVGVPNFLVDLYAYNNIHDTKQRLASIELCHTEP